MNNTDYWKEAYKDFWKQSGEREEKIKSLIEELAGVKVQFAGLGSGSNDFITGDAGSNGFEKGSADLWIEGTNIFLEITGPLSENVTSKDSLWIRPDKIENAKNNFPQKRSLILHCIDRENLIRVIILNEEFFRNYDSGKYDIVTPFIRGRKERYAAIKPDDPSIKPFALLVNSLKKIKVPL